MYNYSVPNTFEARGRLGHLTRPSLSQQLLTVRFYVKCDSNFRSGWSIISVWALALYYTAHSHLPCVSCSPPISRSLSSTFHRPMASLAGTTISIASRPWHSLQVVISIDLPPPRSDLGFFVSFSRAWLVRLTFAVLGVIGWVDVEEDFLIRDFEL